MSLTFGLFVTVALPAQAVTPGNEHFARTWARTDQPVIAGHASRTWMWGPEANTGILFEEYEDSPGSQRQVQYYDKSRMEITHPSADPSLIWYVTNGLLSKELITGLRQTGDNTFVSETPAQVPVAGDGDDPNGPTYATFTGLLNAPALPDGAAITQRVTRAGVVSDDPELAAYGVTASHRLTVPGIDHQVASPFWTFMNSTGIIYENEQYASAALFQSPFYATGYPITEAYWADVKIAGTVRLVLIQCFERRCLTYTPGNPAGFETEAGNVGQHYWTWRYVQIPNEHAGQFGPDPG
jgi:hypothetical protein